MSRRVWLWAAAAVVMVLGCNLTRALDSGDQQSTQEAEPDTATQTVDEAQAAAPTATPYPALDVPRIGIRVVDGVGEFYNTATDEKFVPRGVNYVDFYREGSGYADAVMATDAYDPGRVREAFRHLSELGYNTVRIFIDNCGTGAYCVGKPAGNGINPGYLDNMVDLMHIAGEEGIYVLFTSSALPENGGYWGYFFERFDPATSPGFTGPPNADYLHELGVEIKQQYWRDIMSGLAERDAPFEVMLGWLLANEYWMHGTEPPMSLDSGEALLANGQTYDLSDPAQKRQMVIDGTRYYIDALIPIVREYDPDSNIGMGFFVPQFPNPSGIGGDWYVDTAPLVEDSNLDFFDFHAYYDADLWIDAMAENFGMPGHEEKPVIMGETGAGPQFVPSAASSLSIAALWWPESCAAGFDGWLYWGYYPWPDDLEGTPWVPLEDGELILRGLAPVNYPDPCVEPDLVERNVAFRQPVTVSRQGPGEEAIYAVDGGVKHWSPADVPPQWIEITLDGPTAIRRMAGIIVQYPPGETHHRFFARLADNRLVLLAEFRGFTTNDVLLSVDLPYPLADVIAVRVESLASDSAPAWREIEAVNALDVPSAACVGFANGPLDFFSEPGDGAEVFSTLAAGQGVVIVGPQGAGADPAFWLTASGTYVRGDAVTTVGECTF